MTNLIIHTDGGSRGNPGPAACAAIFFDSQKQTLASVSKYLGVATNNHAEYQGVILALAHLLSNSYLLKNITQLDFNLDSELVVKQLNGQYKVKHPEIIPLHQQVQSLIVTLKLPISFNHVLRHLNKDADLLLNQCLDQHIKA